MVLHYKSYSENLSSLPFCTSVWCDVNGGQIVIHMSCEEGNESMMYNSLPYWIINEMEVLKSHGHIFIKPQTV